MPSRADTTSFVNSLLPSNRENSSKSYPSDRDIIHSRVSQRGLGGKPRQNPRGQLIGTLTGFATGSCNSTSS
jgi:hypothetical protein